jgi:hypothetical protein
MMLRRDLRQSYRAEVAERLNEIFGGQDLARVRERLTEIHARGPRLAPLRRPAHARRRRQRAHQHPGAFLGLRHAPGGRPPGRAHHGAGDRAGRRHLGRARHRHHQAPVPRAREARRLRRLQAAGRPARALQSGQADAGLRVGGRLHAVAAPGAAGGHHPGGDRARRAQRRRQALPALRQVQAQVHDPRPAGQSAIIRRATRSWAPGSSSRPSSTRSRPAAVSRCATSRR